MGLPLPLREMRSIPCIFCRHLIFQGMTKPNKLHQAATRYVSARAQASLIESMLEQEILTEKELEDLQARSTIPNSHTKAKNADVVTYRMSTGFEAVMGYLHMTGELSRLEELINWCIQQVEEGRKQ